MLAELARVLAYPKIASRVRPTQARDLLDLLRHQADQHPDPNTPPGVRSPDPDDDYLIALAETAAAVLVSGDADLTGLADRIPVHTPADFRTLLADD